MENKIKVFAMVILCVLDIAAASNASSGVKHRALAGEDKRDGKTNEPDKITSSHPPVSPPIQNAAPTVQGHTSPPQPSKSLPISKNSDSSGFRSPPIMDSSTKTAPPLGPDNLNPGASRHEENTTSMNPPTKEEHKASEAPEKEGDKPVQSPRKEDRKAPPDPEKSGGMTSQAPTKDNVPKGSQGILESGSGKSKNESCEAENATNFTCQKGVLVACLLQSSIESTEFFLLVQNTGADDLNVNIKSPSNIKIDSKSLNLLKHSNKKVNLMADTSRGLKIILSTEEGEDCVVQTKISSSDWFNIQQVRPMHGAFFLFAIITIVGGICAFWKFRRTKNRVDDAGIPYQQLEMATHTQSTSMAANEVPADSWDQSWDDDDWDDEEAVVRTAGKQLTETVPSNGLSSRSANPSKNGWEIDWDD